MSLNASLQRYLTDLGLTIPAKLDLDFVRLVQKHHVAKYSFNNLSVVLRESMPLDLDALLEKVVLEGRGGYCFEHNKLTYELLKALGYDVRILVARVLNNVERDVARSHRISLLTMNGQDFIVDTGFGGDSPIEPFALVADKPQKIGLDTYRVLYKSSQEYDFQILKEGEYFTLYRFDFATYSDVDCEVGHLYSHKHEQAVFLNNLVISLKFEDRTVSLQNPIFTIRRGDEKERRLIEDKDELQSVLQAEFDMALSPRVAEDLFDRFLAPKLAEIQEAKQREHFVPQV